ncbi:histidinol phosphate phosphatase [Sulfurifustis variabilis]|uniref:Histidinol phosphate phosphatase n=1 Tax=Sulfurifustis variabilis TaxID=1675686 RepID=A0A1B4V0B9_9GAMM|nr:inositol monophosphatase family protein [Sulfurifustis variabilis]BAU46886.1 histidinol phosphate phosphatase [Sulfurifustis variabilis]
MIDPRTELAADEIEHLYEAAIALADEAREIIQGALAAGFSVKHKPDGTLVTSTDIQVEERLRAAIEERFACHGIIGEELPARHPDSALQWILDPIDGTEDFVHRVPTFGTILALHYKGEPIVGILEHTALGLRASAAYGHGTYYRCQRSRLADLPPEVGDDRARVILSARGNFIRYRDEGATFDALARTFPNHRIYRSCYGHTLVATGAADAMVDFHDSLWDLAAARIAVEEAGGAYRTVREFELPGGQRIYSSVFGKPALVERILAVIGAAGPQP